MKRTAIYFHNEDRIDVFLELIKEQHSPLFFSVEKEYHPADRPYNDSGISYFSSFFYHDGKLPVLQSFIQSVMAIGLACGNETQDVFTELDCQNIWDTIEALELRRNVLPFALIEEYANTKAIVNYLRREGIDDVSEATVNVILDQFKKDSQASTQAIKDHEADRDEDSEAEFDEEREEIEH